MRYITVVFAGHELPVIINEDGNIFIDLKSICRNLRLSYWNQVRKICSDEIFRGYWIDLELDNSGDKQTESMVFLDITLLQVWLMTVDVCPSLRQVLQTYRQEAFREIFEQLAGERRNLPLLRSRVSSLDKEVVCLEDQLRNLNMELEILNNRLVSVKHERDYCMRILEKQERLAKKTLKVIDMSIKKKTTDSIVLTDRDQIILKALYRCKTLTVSQINERYFESRWYCYKRLKLLEKAGYVESRALVEKKRKVGACYYLTKRGAEKLSVRHEQRWLQETWKQPRLVALSEIFMQAEKAGWKWLNSREAKKKFNLNRNSYLDGVLVFGETEYFLYYLDKKTGPNSIKAIQAEIKNQSRFGLVRYIILHRSEGLPDLFENTCGARELLVMPHDVGLILIKAFSKIKDLLQKTLGGSLVECNRFFARYLVELKGREYYVAPLISYDLVMEHYLKEYTLEEASRDGRGVFAFILENQEPCVDPSVYPHIKFVTIQTLSLIN